MDTTPTFPVRRMQKPPRWPEIVVFVVWAALVGLVVYFSWWFTLLPLCAVVVLAIFFERRIRCPQCGGRVKSREIEVETPPRGWRKLYDCPHCQTTWDPCIVTYDAA
jgi:hypothetical protein